MTERSPQTGRIEDASRWSWRLAVVALGASATPSDKDVIQGLINKIAEDSDNIMKNFCYISLGEIGGETAEKFLVSQLSEVKRAYLPYVGLAVGLTGNPEYGKASSPTWARGRSTSL